MTIPDHIISFHNNREELSSKVKEDTEVILNAINLDEMLDNPEEYLSTLGNLFMEKHQGEFERAFKLGGNHGRNLIG